VAQALDWATLERKLPNSEGLTSTLNPGDGKKDVHSQSVEEKYLLLLFWGKEGWPDEKKGGGWGAEKSPSQNTQG